MEDPNQFRWKISDKDAAAGADKQRLGINLKEAAVKAAVEHGAAIADQIQSLIKRPNSDVGTDAVLKELKDWAGQYSEFTCASIACHWKTYIPLDAVSSTHETFRVYAGVAGETGAGKTSVLNAILSIKDLLSVSNEAAATAVVCLISWNNDDDPAHTFRAEVVFKKRDTVVKELDAFFRELKRFYDTKCGPGNPQNNFSHANGDNKMDVSDDDGDQGDTDMDEPYIKLLDIWGLSAEVLRKESTDGLLNRNPDVTNLLGTTKEIKEENVHDFSEKIRPYLDSGSAKHGSAGKAFPAWPLIEEVRIFVKADILRNDIVLVDLPGLGDADESRQAVARRYFQKLTLTVIVAPCHRAVDNQTSVSLMSENQELTMQMDGKFHKKGFCVVLSKIDTIDSDSYLKQHRQEAQEDQKLQDNLNLLAQMPRRLRLAKADVKNGNTTLRSLETALRKATIEARKAKSAGELFERDGTVQAMLNNHSEEDEEALGNLREHARAAYRAVIQQKLVVADLAAAEKRIDVQQRNLHGYKRFWCIKSRSDWICNRISQDLASRQVAIVPAGYDFPDDDHVNIFPISSSEYWQTLAAMEEGGDRPLGFRNIRSTGIPALKSWLRDATMNDRERHLDATLNTFLGLFNTIEALTKQDWAFVRDHSDAQAFRHEILDKPFEELRKVRAMILNSLV